MSVVEEKYMETYRSLVTLSVEGFKFLALANGGAVIAILAYLGDVSGKSPGLALDMRMPMFGYLLGLLLCGFAFWAAYMTQLRLLQELADDSLEPQHERYLAVAIVSFLGSLLAFGVASIAAVICFSAVR